MEESDKDVPKSGGGSKGQNSLQVNKSGGADQSGTRRAPLLPSFFKENSFSLEDGDEKEYSCRNLLKDLDMVESDDGEMILGEEEMVNLPQEMVQAFSLGSTSAESRLLEDCPELLEDPFEETDCGLAAETRPQEKLKEKKKDKIWGPVLVEPRPRRTQATGLSMLEKAQALKKKKNLETQKGNTGCVLVGAPSGLAKCQSYDGRLEDPVPFQVPAAVRRSTLPTQETEGQAGGHCWLRKCDTVRVEKWKMAKPSLEDGDFAAQRVGGHA